MNPACEGSAGDYVEGTGSIGGWEKSEMREYLKETIKPIIPETVRNRIVEVKKYSRIYDTSNTVVNNVLTLDDLWIPSKKEIDNNKETAGVTYSGITLKKKKASGTNNASWWLRTVNTLQPGKWFELKDNTGGSSHNAAESSYSIALGFCLG